MILLTLDVLFAQPSDLYWMALNVWNVQPIPSTIIINFNVYNVEEEDSTIKLLKLANAQKIWYGIKKNVSNVITLDILTIL